MSEPLPPIEPVPGGEPVTAELTVRRTQNPTTALIIGVVASFLLIAAILAVFQLNSQNSLSSIRTEQDKSQVARDQLSQVICTIWRSAPQSSRASRSPGQVSEIDRLCAVLLPVHPSPSPAKG